MESVLGERSGRKYSPGGGYEDTVRLFDLGHFGPAFEHVADVVSLPWVTKSLTSDSILDEASDWNGVCFPSG